MKNLFLLGAASLMTLAVIPALSGEAVAATARIPSCTNLIVASTEVQGAGGTGTTSCLVANVGRRCNLKGYLRVVFFQQNGSTVDHHNIH